MFFASNVSDLLIQSDLQTIPILVKPCLRLFAVGTMRAKQCLESYGMFHDDRMAQFVNYDVVNHKLRGFYDTPVDGNVFLF